MLRCFYKDQEFSSIAIHPLTCEGLSDWLISQEPRVQQWVKSTGYLADEGALCFIPGQSGELQAVLLGIKSEQDFWVYGGLPAQLPEGHYHLALQSQSADHWQRVLLAWALGCYQFNLYKACSLPDVKLALPDHCDEIELDNLATSIYLVRDMINMPAEVFGPEQLAEAVESVAEEFEAEFSQVVGDELLVHNYPLIHAVGRAAVQAPRLLDLRWGKAEHPRITIVGKGVCYDTGGLSLKATTGMLLMKKDMGGAAHALALARLIMAANLPVNLRLLIPAVENSVAANSYRPGDVVVARNGISVEITNTDAEGRLVLADTLAEAMNDKPEVLIDFATLTGAARTALGPELPALFSNSDHLASALVDAGLSHSDPMWRMPLYKPYRELYLHSNVADISNASSKTYAGAVVAALFLELFVEPQVQWAHFDIMAYNEASTPGRPAGGEAMSLRACYAYLKARYESA